MLPSKDKHTVGNWHSFVQDIYLRLTFGEPLYNIYMYMNKRTTKGFKSYTKPYFNSDNLNRSDS